MGVTKNYKCKHCNFTANHIQTGYGFDPFIDIKAVICKDCGCVMSKSFDKITEEILPEDSHCDNCNSENLIIWDYKCPKCGSKMSKYGIITMWD